MRYRVETINSNGREATHYVIADGYYLTGDIASFWQYNELTPMEPAPTGPPGGVSTLTMWPELPRINARPAQSRTEVAALRGWTTIVEDNTYAPEQNGDERNDI